MHAIEVEGLTKTYPGGVAAVKPLHFDVAPGEVFGLLGPNGAGKSTTVVSQPPRLATASASERLRRSQASWTASSASLSEPSIR